VRGRAGVSSTSAGGAGTSAGFDCSSGSGTTPQS
jgi:hypothetical protein